MMTMSHQSALLGALAIQLELPSAVRKLLMVDGAFDAFATPYSTHTMPRSWLHRNPPLSHARVGRMKMATVAISRHLAPPAIL